jgi:hypothetical protein
MALIHRNLVNGSLLDISGNQYNGVFTPGVSRGFIKSDRGLALEFDGAATKVQSPIITGATVGLSWMTWIKITEGSSSYPTIWYFTKSGGDYLWISYHKTNKDWAAQQRTGGGVTTVTKYFSTDRILDKWHHLAFTYDRVSGDMKLYTDAVLQETENFSPALDSYTNLTYAQNPSNLSSDLREDSRVYDEVLTLEQLEDIYNATKDMQPIAQTKRNFYYPYPQDLSKVPNLVGAWDMHLDGNRTITDVSSTQNHSNAIDGKPLNTKEGINFDGDNDQIQIPNHDDYDVTDALTVGAWIFCTNNGTSNDIINKYTSSAWPWKLGIDTSIGRMTLSINDSSAHSPTPVFPNNLVTWMHVAATYDRNAASDQVRHYVNGIQVGTGTKTSAINTDSSPIRIGSRHWDPDVSNAFGGQIYDPRFYGAALTPKQMADWFNERASQIIFKEDFSDEGADGVVSHPKIGLLGQEPTK